MSVPVSSKAVKKENDMPQIYQLPLGALGTNCYIIPGEDSRAVVIDPASAEEVEMFLNTHGLKLGTIIVTHGHYDHFAGAAQLMESTGASLLASAPDEAMYSSAAKCWADFMPVEFRPIKPDKLFSDGEEFTAEGLKFRVMGAPGHTAGSCLLFTEIGGEPSAFCGDVVFCMGVGRTDGYSGSTRDMLDSLEKIAKLPGDFKLYPGHGSTTTLDYERQNNPYLGRYA